MDWLKRLFGSKSTPPPDVRPGRNEVCWCGSGVKYKRCHWETDQARLRSRTRTPCARS